MYCGKCGQLLTEDQEFCTHCGNKIFKKFNQEISNEDSSNEEISNDEAIANNKEVSNEEKISDSNEQKDSITFEDVSNKVVSDVTKAVNNIVDKSKEVTQKIKNDKKINNNISNFIMKTNVLKQKLVLF